MDDLPLSGQTALVTGGAKRLGKAIALALAARGADIALHYHHSADEAGATAAAIRALGRRCAGVQADLADPRAPATIFGAANSALGAIRILINSAAVFPRGTLADTTPDAWDATFGVNLRAPFFLCQAFAGQTKDGTIINLADWRAERPDGDYLAYSLSKAGLVALTLGLAKALAPGIRVNAIEPGAILPPPGRPADALAGMRASIPLNRSGSAKDIAQAVVFLAESPFVTGEVLRVTGGQHL